MLLEAVHLIIEPSLRGYPKHIRRSAFNADDITMTEHFKDTGFIPLNIAVLTVSDSRSETDDKSGALLREKAEDAGHKVIAKEIVQDDVYLLRAVFSRWIADPRVQVVLTTGGTGITGRDSTPEAIAPLLDKEIQGFGELFRTVSFGEIGASTIQSRALAGLANGTLVFCLPGSSGACRTAWDRILAPQLDHRTRPCNFAQLMPRLREQ
jgi:molybdenum cofactor biosynthesis protein B